MLAALSNTTCGYRSKTKTAGQSASIFFSSNRKQKETNWLIKVTKYRYLGVFTLKKMPAHCAVVNCSDKYVHAGSISFHR